MARRAFLTDAERHCLFGVPTAREELARHYVLSTRDLALVEARRGEANRIGFAVQLAMLPHPGFGFTLEGGAPPCQTASKVDPLWACKIDPRG